MAWAREHTVFLVAAVVMVAVLVVGGLATGLVDDVVNDDDGLASEDTTDGTTDTSQPDVDSLDSGGQELVNLLARSRDITLHVRYTSVEGADSNLVFELWRDGDLARQDSIAEVSGQRVESRAVQTGTEVTSCQRQAEQDWQCEEGVSADLGTDQLVEQLVGQLAGAEVVGESDTIDGVAVRCFTISGGTEPEQRGLCVDEQGVPRTLGTGPGRLEAEVVEFDVDPSVFVVPTESVGPNA